MVTTTIKLFNQICHEFLINNIIRQLNEIQDGSLWFDQCFRDKIDNLSDDDAFTRPIPKIHSVAEQYFSYASMEKGMCSQI